ncbi:MAG TPA: 6-phosphogluconolactonase [Flavitalea sp.]|nr:6-phosphogluconolactonase [Flavitalea sp.]
MNVHAFENAEEMSAAAAEWITDKIETHLSAHTRFTWLLAGGNTPKKLFDILATDFFRERNFWKNVHIFFGDERFVPFDDPENNGRMAFEHLLHHVSIPNEQIHFIRTDIHEKEAAKEYEKLLHNNFPDNTMTFDLTLLGMGNDGHTLSLFPHSGTVYEQHRWVITSAAPTPPVNRITLTGVATLSSRCILFLIAGSTKADSLKQVLQGEYAPDLYPAQLFRSHREIHWFADRDALKNTDLPKHEQ